MGKVDFGGVRKRVCLDHVADVVPGEYVLVHVGFALSRLDEQEAARVLEFLTAIGDLDELTLAQDAGDAPLLALAPEERSPQAGSDEAPR